jgi:hypothetical protein
MDSDWNSFITVSILLALMIVLANYMQNAALVEKDWVNLKCNPLYMLISSLTQDNETSLANFKKCVNNV